MGSTGLLFAHSGIQRVFRCCGIALCLTVVAQPESGSDRVRALSDRILAPCCWREAASVHRSPAAEDIRQRITKEVAAERSDEVILESLVRDYGKRILREPEGPQGRWLYWIPVVVAGCAAIALSQFLRHSAARMPTSTLTEPALADFDVLEED